MTAPKKTLKSPDGLAGQSLAPAHGSPTDSDMLDWLEKNCKVNWPYGNEASFALHYSFREGFYYRPTIREILKKAIESENVKAEP